MAISPPTDLLEAATRRAVALRRDLHRHPELGLTEFRTASLVAERLTDLGLDVKLGREVMDSASRIGLPPEAELERCYRRAEAEGAPAPFLPALAGGHTAVVGMLRGAEPGPVIALRVDMDALPILEDATQAHLPAREGFVSAHPGVMHACGHDVHTALGLAAAEVLSGLRHRVKGTVKFVFQPAEEGGRGAAPMVKAGVVDDVDHFVAIHIGTGVPSRSACAAVDGHLASVKLDVTFRGRAAHAGGQPDEGRNALLAAAQAVQALYGISRHHAGRSRINVGTMSAGSGRNVIADHAFLQLEVRGETEEIADYMRHRAEAVLRGAAMMQDLDVEIRFVGRTTTADSDAELARLIADVGANMPGISVSPAPHRAGGSEDATYFMRRVQERGGKAAYMVIGSDLASGHHTPLFDIDETDMPWGIEILTRTLLRLGGA
jgi:aminobenzoyl-glutamate utilization protein A